MFQTESSGDGFFYVEAENAGKFQAYTENGTLCIRITNGEKKWNEISGCRITLYVPEDQVYQNVAINLGAGLLEFGGLNTTAATLEVGAGQITVKGAFVDSMELRVGAGKIWLEDMQVADMKADVGMGVLEAEGMIGRGASLSCAMGSVDLRLEGREEDFNYKLSGSMGNINLGAGSYSGMGMEKSIDNGAEKTIELKCSMGNISLLFTMKD